MSVGVLALEEGGRVDFARLRRERRARVEQVMAELDCDVLLLGREYNARYASGVRRLSVASTRPFSPGCVLVRSTGECHVMSTWEEGIPHEVPRENLFGMTWNPSNFVDVLQKIPGLADARRVGIDSMTALFAGLVPMALPHGEFVDVTPALLAARMIKTADEVACIRTAVAITESALMAAASKLHPGVRERELLGAFEERMAAMGANVPAMEGTFCATTQSGDQPLAALRRLVGDHTVESGDLVVMSSSALFAGYEGPAGRTWPCADGRLPEVAIAQQDLYRRWQAVWKNLSAVLRPGSSGADLRAAYERSGETLPPFPIVRSIGIGYEAPIAGSTLGVDFDARWRLEAGMVLAVEAAVVGSAGGYVVTDTVLVTPDGYEVLSTLGHGPLAED